MLLCPWDFPGKNTGVGCHFLLQGIFLTQGLNLGLLHCGQILCCLSHQGSRSSWEVLTSCRISPKSPNTGVFKKKKFILFIWLHLDGIFSWSMWDLVPWPGIEPGPLQWKLRVLATGPAGKSPHIVNSSPSLFYQIFALLYSALTSLSGKQSPKGAASSLT